MTWPSWLPANRIASLAAFLTGIGAALAGLESWGGLPQGVASTIVTITGIIGSTVTCLHFMLGSQKSEALAARPNITTPPGGITMAAIDDLSASVATLQTAVAAAVAELQKLSSSVQASAGSVTPEQAAGIVAQVAQVATDAQDAVNAAEAALNPAPAA
jgi:hypothetical protein